MKCNLFLIMILASFCMHKTIAQEWKQSNDEQGLVVMAAEDYSDYRPGSGDKAGETFTLEDSVAGFYG